MAKSTTDTTQTKVKTTKKSAPKAAAAPEKKLVGENTTFTITLKQPEIQAARQRHIQRAQSSLKLEGFRKGKVPLKLVEERVGEQRLQEMVLEDLLSAAYSAHVKAHNLSPMTDPDVKAEQMPVDGDWVFTLSIAEPPQFELGDYASVVKKLKAKNELWTGTPTDAEGKDLTAEELRQRQVNAVLEALIGTVEIPVPELLLRKETERSLHEFHHQLEHMGMEMKEYLEKTQKSEESFQQEVAARHLLTFQVDFFLGAVVRDQKILVNEAEIKAITGEKATDDQRRYVIATLLKQKAMDFLLTL